MRSGPAASRALSLSANPAQATNPQSQIEHDRGDDGFHLTPDSQSPGERREPKGLNISDENEVQIATIARHLRGLGLTEEQIQTHVAPLRPKQAPPPRKLVRSGIPKTSLFRPMRKGFSPSV